MKKPRPPLRRALGSGPAGPPKSQPLSREDFHDQARRRLPHKNCHRLRSHFRGGHRLRRSLQPRAGLHQYDGILHLLPHHEDTPGGTPADAPLAKCLRCPRRLRRLPCTRALFPQDGRQGHRRQGRLSRNHWHYRYPGEIRGLSLGHGQPGLGQNEGYRLPGVPFLSRVRPHGPGGPGPIRPRPP